MLFVVYNYIGVCMFKKFYIFLIIFSFLGTFILSYSISNENNYFYPVKNNNIISSYYGTRNLFGRYHFHNGIDIPSPVGTSVHSLSNGIVSYIGFDANGYGNFIIILHQNSFKSLYGHLSNNIPVNIGDNVILGQVIAYIGPKILENGKQNGNTTGPHLHFTVFDNKGKTIDPLSLKYKKE